MPICPARLEPRGFHGAVGLAGDELLDWRTDPRKASLLTHLFGGSLRSRTDALQALLRRA